MNDDATVMLACSECGTPEEDVHDFDGWTWCAECCPRCAMYEIVDAWFAVPDERGRIPQIKMALLDAIDLGELDYLINGIRESGGGVTYGAPKIREGRR